MLIGKKPWLALFLALAARPLGFAGDSDAAALDARLAKEVAENGYASLAAAVVHGDETVYLQAFGMADVEKGVEATPDTIYRIGSITKTFTTTLLAMLRDEGLLALDDPVAKHLPKAAPLPVDPRGAPAITLRHLATHTSGLPRDPINLQPREGDPFGGYTETLLRQGLGQTKLTAPIGYQVLYSNLGMGLLGHALEKAGGAPYATLLRTRIFDPLGMTAATLAPEGPGFATGYLANGKPAKTWHLGVLDPAGAIGANVRDMARFLSLQLRANQANVEPVRGGTLHELHRPQRILDGWRRGVGLGWFTDHTENLGDMVWHNGGMDGFHSFAAFSPEYGVGVVLLTNSEKKVDDLGRWLVEQAIERFGQKRLNPAHANAAAAAKALVDHFKANPGDDLAEHFHPEFLKKIPLARIKPIFSANFNQLGACRGVEGLEAAGPPGRLKFQFVFENGSQPCVIEVDQNDPQRIVYLRFHN